MASVGKVTKLVLSQFGRQILAKNSITRCHLPAIMTVRSDSIFTKYREPPNGFLFNEKPRKPGEKREWEDWEAIWYVGWGVSIVIVALTLMYKPDTGFKAEAIQEAQRKIAELDALEESDAATED